MAPPGGAASAGADADAAPEAPNGTSSDLVRVPLWVLVGACSGDKGGDANVGLWADEEAVAAWLQRDFTTELFTALLPEAAPFEVSRYALSNLRARQLRRPRFLGWGVASNLRLDTQAKGLGELLRARHVEVPTALVTVGNRRRGCIGLAEDASREASRGRWPAPGHLAGWRRGVRPPGRTRCGHRHRRAHGVECLHRPGRPPGDVVAPHTRPRRLCLGAWPVARAPAPQL